MPAKRKDSKGRVLQKGESQRSDGLYVYRYTNRYQKRISIYASSLRELREKEQEISVNQYFGVENHPNDLKLIDIIDRHRELVSNRRPGTIENYLGIRNTISRYPIANKIASKIKSSDLKVWMLELSEQGYASSTISGYMRLIRASYKTAIEDELIMRSPAQFNTNFIPAQEGRRALTNQEQQSFERFLAKSKNRSWHTDLYRVLIGTGMRISELVGLTESDIDFSNNTISITKQMRGNTKKTLYVSPPKTTKGIRTIPMTPTVSESIKSLIDNTHQTGEPCEIDGHNDFILRTQNGMVQTPQYYSRIFKELSEEHNKTCDMQIKLTPHILRHTFCTNLIQAGMSVTSVQYLMGHSKPTITLDVYSHGSKDQAMAEFIKLSSM